MLIIPPKTRADGPSWCADARVTAAHKAAPPLDMSRWRLDGRLSKLVVQRFDMDNYEALRFALACGGDLAATAGHEPFDRHLRIMILRYDLTGPLPR